MILSYKIINVLAWPPLKVHRQQPLLIQFANSANIGRSLVNVDDERRCDIGLAQHVAEELFDGSGAASLIQEKIERLPSGI